LQHHLIPFYFSDQPAGTLRHQFVAGGLLRGCYCKSFWTYVYGHQTFRCLFDLENYLFVLHQGLVPLGLDLAKMDEDRIIFIPVPIDEPKPLGIIEPANSALLFHNLLLHSIFVLLCLVFNNINISGFGVALAVPGRGKFDDLIFDQTPSAN
jgi:hypothetical protein